MVLNVGGGLEIEAAGGGGSSIVNAALGTIDIRQLLTTDITALNDAEGGMRILNAGNDVVVASLAFASGGSPDLQIENFIAGGGVIAALAAAAAGVAGGDISLTTGDGGLAADAGGDFLLAVGQGAGSGASGNFFVNTLTGIGADGGSVSSSESPGLVSMYGIGTDAESKAGNLELWGGYATGITNLSIGGDLMLWGGGGGGGAARGGCAMLIGGESDDDPGDAEMLGGTATVGGVGGDALITGGPGFGSNFAGGVVLINGGLGIGTGDGDRVLVSGGFSGLGLTGDGGELDLRGGQASSTNGNGGDIQLLPAAGNGSGIDGVVKVADGRVFRIQNLAGDDHVSCDHDGTDFNQVAVQTADWNISGFSGGMILASGVDLEVGGDVGFYGTAAVAQQTGVAVTDVAIHAALVALGLITA